MKIALIDTGHSNLRSVERALLAAAERRNGGTGLPIQVLVTTQPDVVRSADKLVVPGQGGFGDCLRGLRTHGLDEVLIERIGAGVPYLGICLGLQALFESSAEAPGVPGLGLFKGTCSALLPSEGIKVPHMGWNQLSLTHGGHLALREAGGDGTWVYFVHSFHAVPEDKTLVRAVVLHGTQEVTAAVSRDNVFATQFHPEKSQGVGIDLLRAYLSI